MSPASVALKVFISYSHHDDEWRRNLDAHLSLLKREGVLDVWHDRRLLAGEEWAQTIDDRLRSADLVLLLVSADFIQSDYCFGLEMSTALAQDRAGRSRVVPIIVRRCDWETAPFGKLQAVPRDNVPVATHPRGPDEALTEVAKELRRLAAEIVDTRSSEATVPVKDDPAVAPERRRSWWSRHRRMLVGGTGALAAIAAIALSVAFTLSSSMVSEGRSDLRVGAYDTAQKRFERAAAINPFDRRAHRGLRLARLGLMIPNLAKRADEFSRELEGLERSDPHDPQVLLFRGDRAMDVYRRAREPRVLDAAVEVYRDAVERDPAFSEARARLAHVYRLQQDLPEAERELREAIKAGGDAAARSPRYQHDLASVLAAQGRASEALSLYEGNGEFVLSAVEGGMLLWSMTAPEALGRARSKLAGALDRTERLRSGGDQYAWFLVAGDEALYLGLPEAKVCFTTLALAATERMLGEKSSADARLRTASDGSCEAVKSDASLVICARLDGGSHTAARQTQIGDTRAWLGCTPSTPTPRASFEAGAVRTGQLAPSGRYLV